MTAAVCHKAEIIRIREPGIGYNAPMIYLNADDFVGKGSKRYCYRHPDNPERCIKIAYKPALTDKKKQNEFNYLRMLERRGIDWSHMPRCYGWATTDIGAGLVFDFFHTHDGLAMPSIGEHLREGRITLDALSEPLETLRRYLLRNRIVTRDLNATNIVCNVEGSDAPVLYLIDGIGNADFIKVANYLPFYTKKKTNRHWGRFMDKLSLTDYGSVH